MFRVSRKLAFHGYNYSTAWAKGRRRGEIMTKKKRERDRDEMKIGNNKPAN